MPSILPDKSTASFTNSNLFAYARRGILAFHIRCNKKFVILKNNS